MSLNDKQRRFAAEYLTDLTVTGGVLVAPTPTDMATWQAHMQQQQQEAESPT